MKTKTTKKGTGCGHSAGYAFTVTVKTTGSKAYAEAALQEVLADRLPSGCEFRVEMAAEHKCGGHQCSGKEKAYMEWVLSGAKIGFEMALLSIERQMAELGIKSASRAPAQTTLAGEHAG